MAIHDLTKTQVVVKDIIDEQPIPKQCNCSQKITDLELQIKQLKVLILNGRDKDILNINE
tara:strand:- start:284 stop:463 length:180 start_codon:yes stop_codon:yes gene_type:complete